MKANERIRELREEGYYSQQKIADHINVAQRTYSDYESGRISIPLDRLIVLAKYYNVSMDYISGVTDEKKEFPKNK